jgi:hypothetical protein
MFMGDSQVFGGVGPKNKKAAGSDLPTASNREKYAINPWADLSSQNKNKNKTSAQIDCLSFFLPLVSQCNFLHF